MKIGIPKETDPKETRVSVLPVSIAKLKKEEVEVLVEEGLGQSIYITDSEYEKAGAKIASRDEVLRCDVIMRIRKPALDEVSTLKKDGVHISFLDPFNETELIDAFVKEEINAVSMEMIPRTTLAQKMDALSSQASLAGYVTVMLAAGKLNKAFPMMMTPAGTLAPSRVFIIGAGVAGLQAIATAKRLGARVEAFDTRPVVEEQVQSLGAKFVKIDIGETGQTKDGYAKQLTDEQLQMQRDGMAKICSTADIVITTAQLFGRKAPVIVTTDMINKMKPGSVIIDMAVETGGNVEGSKVDEEVVVNGVKIIGFGNLPGHVALHSSQMYSSNLANLFEHLWDDESKKIELDREDEIIQGCLITRNGKVVNKMINDFRNKDS